MTFKPSTNFPAGAVFKTTYGRKYIVLGGPWGDNRAVWYSVMDEHDDVVALQTERSLEGMQRLGKGKHAGKNGD